MENSPPGIKTIPGGDAAGADTELGIVASKFGWAFGLTGADLFVAVRVGPVVDRVLRNCHNPRPPNAAKVATNSRRRTLFAGLSRCSRRDLTAVAIQLTFLLPL